MSEMIIKIYKMQKMKNFLILILAFAVAGFWSCSDEALGPYLDNFNAPQITAPTTGTSFVLLEENAGNDLADVQWSAADYGDFAAAVSYIIQVDKVGNEFGQPQKMGPTSNTQMTLNTAAFNSALINLGLTADFETMVELRVEANINDNVDKLYSDVVTLTVNPYLVEIDYAKLWVPGAHNGWDPGNETTVVWSPKDNGRYEGYVWFPEDNNKYKYTPAPNWDADWGDNDGDGDLDPSPGSVDITATGPAGLYKLNVNTIALTHSFLQTNWGVIGDATSGGWDTDTDMTYDLDNHILTATLDLVVGNIKFRVNDGWDIDLGDDDTDGSMEYGGKDIPISEAGNYTVTLNLSQALYSYKIVKN
jgi:hypothetical protein